MLDDICLVTHSFGSPNQVSSSFFGNDKHLAEAHFILLIFIAQLDVRVMTKTEDKLIKKMRVNDKRRTKGP